MELCGLALMLTPAIKSVTDFANISSIVILTTLTAMILREDSWDTGDGQTFELSVMTLKWVGGAKLLQVDWL